VTELVDLCGYLPLAIGLLSGRLRSHRAWSVRHLTDTLRTAQDRLAELHAENVAVEAAFNLSYDDLSGDQQRLFRRLGLHPGREIDAYAAAALDDTELAQTRRRLDALYNYHLIDEPIPGRYRLHDLVHAYARTLASHDDSPVNDTAVDRVLDYYLHAATTANRHIARRSEPAVPPVAHQPAAAPDLSKRRDALAWLDMERSNLYACILHASKHSRHGYTVHLARTMHSFLRAAGHWDQAVIIHRTAVTAARLIGDQSYQARALDELGVVQRLTGDYASATTSLTEALSLARHLDDRYCQAHALTNLGTVRYLADEYASATASLTEALALYRGLGDRQGQAHVLTSLGTVQDFMGEYPAATASLTEALVLFGDVGDLQGQADALSRFGVVQAATGKIAAAIASQNEALALFTYLGDRLGQAIAFNYLGVAQNLTGDYPAATASLTEAMAFFCDLGDRQGQAEALNNLGALQLDSSSYDAALALHRQALRLAQGMRAPLEEARALEGIGRCFLRGLGADDGIAYLRQALAIYQHLGVPDRERVVAILIDLSSTAVDESIST
jgi:tetratricopeptide (TPR) repeat protein